MKSIRFMSGIALAGALGFGLGAVPADAASVADFYKNKQIMIIVGSSPGGGYDTYARTLARHYPRYIPGSPDIIVKNQPGAGSIVAANQIYNVLPQDGTIIGAIQRNAPLVEILGQKGPEFDPMKFNWLGSLNNEAGILAVRDFAEADEPEDVFDTKVIMGASGPNDTEIYPALLNNTLGAKFQLVEGYPSATAIHLAMERGEVEGVSQSWSSFKIGNKKALEAGKFNLLFQLSLKPLPELTEKGVPLVLDYITEERVLPQYSVEEVKTYFKLMLTSKAMGRPYVLGPKVPAERVKALRSGFMETAADPKFVADANKQGREVSPVSGDEIQEMIREIASAPQETLDQLEELIKYQGPVKRVKIEMVEHTGPVTQTKRGGRRIFIKHDGKEVKAKISGSRTKVTINGKPDKRGNVKVGMTCTFVYPGPGQEAKELNCES